MNYWLLTTEYPPLHGGGISTYCYFTARMFSAEGHSVTVFVQDDDVPDYTISVDGPVGAARDTPGGGSPDRDTPGITLIRFNSNRNKLHASLGYEARLSYAFADIVRTIIAQKGKPDFIEAQDYKGIAYYLTQFKHTGYEFLEGVPLLMTTHSPAFVYLDYNRVPVYRFPDFWTGEMEKQSIVAVDAVQSPSRFLVEEIQKYMDLSGQKVSVQPYPYQEPHRAAGPSLHAAGATQASAAPSFTPGKLVFYGKLSRQKGSFELLAYFKELWDGGFKHPLHVVGATDIVYHPEMQTMGQLVTKQYQSYIKAGLLQFHGKIHPSRMAGYLEDAHVIIVPSIVENFPYVVIETMSMGRVVLASVQGGQREMIEEGVSGFLFDHNDPSSFSRQLLKILSLEDGVLKDIGLAATRRIRDAYSFPGIYAQKMRLLEEMRAAPRATDHFPFLYQEPIEDAGLAAAAAARPAAADGLEMPTPAGGALLSVVIPYYNMGAYIEECLRSVLDSTHKDMEILVIDDGSTEAESIKKLDSIVGWDRVRVVRQSNKGLALTRNGGAAMARGTYLAFLDADDKVAPTYYEKAVRTLRRNRNVYFAGAWVQYFENTDKMWPTFTPQPPYALVHNPVNSSGLVYKRAAFLAGGLNDKTVDYGLEDYESVVAMLHHGLNGVVLPEVLFHYRVRTGSMIRGITMEKLVYSHKYIVDKHAAYYAKFAAPVVNLLNANGPGYLFDNPTMEVIVHSRMAKENIFVLKIKSFIKRNEKLKKIALTIKKLNS